MPTIYAEPDESSTLVVETSPLHSELRPRSIPRNFGQLQLHARQPHSYSSIVARELQAGGDVEWSHVE
jgi:hypothetical protein